MPLNLAEFHKIYTIARICGLDKQKHYLETLVFTTGATIEVLSELHGYFIVLIKESKIGLEKRLAQNVILIAE